MVLSLNETVAALGKLAPLELAADWDHVGLQIAPSEPGSIRRIFLTIDLTEPVLDEAIDAKADLIVAYHPPMFGGLKRLTGSDPKARLALRVIESGMAVYSPHTALDAVVGGMTDWLVEGLGAVANVSPIQPAKRHDSKQALKLVVFVPADHADRLRHELTRVGAGWIGAYSHCSFNLSGTGTFWGHEGANPVVGEAGRYETVEEIRMEMVCPRGALTEIAGVMESHHPYEEPAWELYPLEAKVLAGAGSGRIAELSAPAYLAQMVQRVKKHLNLKRVRVAAAEAHLAGEPIAQVAVCPGAGGSLFEGLDGPDLYLTGEMRHHDILAKVASGASVILTDHTNTERGYLPIFRDRLVALLGKKARVDISTVDRDPLEIQ